MPTGHVQRIDEDRETVYIVQEGKTLAAPIAEVETKARVPSARVRFDLVRHEGIESAADVRLRSGTRTNRRHRRFGDLTGATRPGAKVQTAASRNFGIDVTTQPFKVARTWLEALHAQDFAGATSLYLPEAVLYLVGAQAEGQRRIRAELEKLDLIDVDEESVEVAGIDRYVRVTCRVGKDRRVIYLVTDRGSIAEQWIDIEPEWPSEQVDGDDSVHVIRRGDVPDRAASYAVERIRRLADRGGRRLRSAQIKLSMADNPRFDRPAMVEASVEFDHLLVRASGSAESMVEAIDAMTTRLGVRIEHQHDRLRHRAAGLEPTPSSWRHGNLARPETYYFDRPVEEREIVRHKSFAPGDMTPDEAALDMAVLDYDFFLFVEIETGRDALLVQGDDGSMLLHGLDGADHTLGSTVNQIEIADTVTPHLAVSAAIDLLNASGGRRQLFVNEQTGRGNVIYRRRDGHYGLITPFDEAK